MGKCCTEFQHERNPAGGMVPVPVLYLSRTCLPALVYMQKKSDEIHGSLFYVDTVSGICRQSRSDEVGSTESMALPLFCVFYAGNGSVVFFRMADRAGELEDTVFRRWSFRFAGCGDFC